MKLKFIIIAFLTIKLANVYGMEKQMAKQFEEIIKSHENYYQGLKKEFNFLRETFDGNTSTQTYEKRLSTAPDIIKKMIAAFRNESGKLLPTQLPQNLLLVGEPGVGKTFLALAIARTIQKNDWIPVFVKSALVCDQYKNSGEQNINKFFDKLISSKNKFVVIFDEIDALALRNRTANIQHDMDTANALWTAFDEIKLFGNIFIIGTSNSIENFPPQLLSRFHPRTILTIQSPGADDIENIIRSSLSGVEIKDFKESYYKSLADYVNGCTAREIIDSLAIIAWENLGKQVTYSELKKELPRKAYLHKVKSKIGKIKSSVWNIHGYSTVLQILLSGLNAYSSHRLAALQMAQNKLFSEAQAQIAKKQLEYSERQIVTAEQQAEINKLAFQKQNSWQNRITQWGPLVLSAIQLGASLMGINTPPPSSSK